MSAAELLDRVARALKVPSAGSSDFDLNPDVHLPPGRKLRPAAVLLPLLRTGDEVSVILTKRSSALIHHPGQIAFPGGKVDEADDGPVAAALREASEEIGLKAENVKVLGTLSPHETVTRFNVTPVLGLVREPFEIVPEPGEVEEVFTVPLAHVTDIKNFQIQSRMWQGAHRYYYTVPYGPYYIWGATAHILHGLAERMAI
ncbi:MAG: CoA pyrophosphatase [Paracoccaceae bacterium]